MYYIIVADIIVAIQPDQGKALQLYERAKTKVRKGKSIILAKAIHNGVGSMEIVATPKPKMESHDQQT